MLKILVPVVIIALAVTSILFGVNQHPVPAAITAYLSITLLVLGVWHLRCLSWQRHEQTVLASQGTSQPANDRSEDPSCRS